MVLVLYDESRCNIDHCIQCHHHATLTTLSQLFSQQKKASTSSMTRWSHTTVWSPWLLHLLFWIILLVILLLHHHPCLRHPPVHRWYSCSGFQVVSKIVDCEHQIFNFRYSIESVIVEALKQSMKYE